jgi:excinuclease ABC subunit C
MMCRYELEQRWSICVSVSSKTPTEKFDAKAFLSALTESPGVYRMLGADGAVLYVGKAKNLKRRVTSYFQKSGLSPRIRLMVEQIAQVDVTATRSEAEALILENTLIKKLAPKYNILFRDDKSYAYIALSGDVFPRLFYHRGGFEKKSDYFGPFPSGHSARESIQFIQKTFLLRTCENAVFSNRSRPCLMHQIKRCKAPCVGLISEADYQSDARRASQFLRGKHNEVIDELTHDMARAAEALHYEQAASVRDQIRNLQTILHRQYVSSTKDTDADILAIASHGDVLCVNLAMVRGGLHLGDRPYLSRLTGIDGSPTPIDLAEGLAAFLCQHYEARASSQKILIDSALMTALPESLLVHAPRTEQERAWMEMASKNATLAVQQHRQTRERGSSRLESLRQALGLSDLPKRIECFDISHTMGEGTVASCVVCQDGTMKRSDYRRFNIEGVTAGDDYAAMRQVLQRRYERLALGEIAAPDLIVIDGGKGQHAVAREVFADLGLDHLQSVGIAKGEGRKPGLETLFMHGQHEPLMLPMDLPGFHLIQEIRDEAHRFAIAGHRARRARARSGSGIEDIPGIGPTRRRNLLAQFGGIGGVKAATVEDLRRVSGISTSLAQAIYQHLHSTT